MFVNQLLLHQWAAGAACRAARTPGDTLEELRAYPAASGGQAVGRATVCHMLRNRRPCGQALAGSESDRDDQDRATVSPNGLIIARDDQL